MSTETQQSKQLLARLRSGDTEAFAMLFDQYRVRLHRLVSLRLDRRLAGRVDADDVLQEIYLDATSRIEHFIDNHSGSFFVWLRLIAIQTMANVFRRHLDAKMRDAKREVSIDSARSYESPTKPIAMQLLGHLTSPSRAAIREETARQLECAIQGMRPIDREVIMLRHFEQLDNKEVADVLGIHEKAASIRYIRAISRLKDLIAHIPGLHGEPFDG